MYMRIIWGRIAAGQWDGFEVAYKKATSLRGDVKGLKNQWLARDQGDPIPSPRKSGRIRWRWN